jgi:AraC-like DNA-binding protein
MILRNFPNSSTDYSVFHRENVLVCAKSADVAYSEHTAPLSIKTCFIGAEIYEINGAQIAVEAGKCLIMNGDQRYASYILSNQEVESFCIFFQDGIEKDVLAVFKASNEKLLSHPESNFPTPFFQNLRQPDSTISARMKILRQAIGNGQNSQLWLDEQANFLLEILLAEHQQILRETEKLPMIRQTTRIEIYKRLNLAKDYIESCYHEPLNLKKLSQIACLSPHHFLRLFKSAFHQTPHQYLTEIRLQKALSLIKQNNHSITEICFNVGFENLSSFSRLFKNRFKLSPNEFRKSNR